MDIENLYDLILSSPNDMNSIVDKIYDTNYKKFSSNERKNFKTEVERKIVQENLTEMERKKVSDFLKKLDMKKFRELQRLAFISIISGFVIAVITMIICKNSTLIYYLESPLFRNNFYMFSNDLLIETLATIAAILLASFSILDIFLFQNPENINDDARNYILGFIVILLVLGTSIFFTISYLPSYLILFILGIGIVSWLITYIDNNTMIDFHNVPVRFMNSFIIFSIICVFFCVFDTGDWSTSRLTRIININKYLEKSDIKHKVVLDESELLDLNTNLAFAIEPEIKKNSFVMYLLFLTGDNKEKEEKARLKLFTINNDENYFEKMNWMDSVIWKKIEKIYSNLDGELQCNYSKLPYLYDNFMAINEAKCSNNSKILAYIDLMREYREKKLLEERS